MNAGQKLVELSGLPSGSALTHLLAITKGTGTGVDRTVFASHMTLHMETPTLTLVERKGVTTPLLSVAKTLATSPKKKRIDVLTLPDALYLVRRTTSTSVAQGKKNQVLVSRDRVVATIN